MIDPIAYLKLKLENVQIKRQLLQTQSQVLQFHFDELSRDEQKLLEELKETEAATTKTFLGEAP